MSNLEGFANVNLNINDLDTNSVLIYLSIAVIPWKSELNDHYRRHHKILKFIKDGSEPTLDFLSEVLCFKQPAQITKNHLSLCEELYNKRVVMPLPLPHSEHVDAFTKLVGTEHWNSPRILAGCYIIKGFEPIRSEVTSLEGIGLYIGQSTHLGHRVKSHAKKSDSTTRLFIESLGSKGLVELCILGNDMAVPKGLTKNQFITLLEQYLIIKLKPTINKKFLATPVNEP